MTVRRVAAAADLLAAFPGSVPEAAEAFLADVRNVAYAAYEGDVAVGYARAVLLTRPDDVRPQVFLYDIGVDEAARRRGHGGALVRALLEECRRVGASEMFVLTNRSNAAAMALYSSTGATSDAGDDEVSLVWETF
ncbi:MAG TPA: GNAT family N-acetyltransferase [Frankiaceae bacterium]|nr:GNAT family N-acetyltransferase [Frankiaceae bacterium]